METKYNLNVSFQDKPEDVNALDFYKTLNAFINTGLFGEKHVKLTGHLVEGYDLNCPVNYEGKFEISPADHATPVSYTLLTPLGRQRVHIHLPDSKIIDFWRTREGTWYDHGTLMDYLCEEFYKELNMSRQLGELIELENNPEGFLERTLTKLKNFPKKRFLQKALEKQKTYGELWNRITHEPDLVESLPF